MRDALDTRDANCLFFADLIKINQEGIGRVNRIKRLLCPFLDFVR